MFLNRFFLRIQIRHIDYPELKVYCITLLLKYQENIKKKQ